MKLQRRAALGLLACALRPRRARASRDVAGERSAVALVGARLHPGDGRRLDDATVVIRQGRIAAAGSAADVPVPPDAVRMDVRGAWVTPGLFDAASLVGLVDINAEGTSREVGLDDRYDAIRAAFDARDGFNPRSAVVPVTRVEGVTTVQLAPKRGLVSGRGAVMRLGDGNVEQMTLAPASALHGSLALPGRFAGYGARGGALMRLRQFFDDVRWFRDNRPAFDRNQTRKLSAERLDLEAGLSVLRREMPLVLEAHRASDIEAALRFAEDVKVRMILGGCDEGHLVGAAIAAAGVPVIASALQNLPRAFEALASSDDNVAAMHAAGVTVVLSPREVSDHLSRTLRFEAGNAVARGLPWEVALTAVTRGPANLFGLQARTGTVAVGLDADLVVWSGDPFEPLTRPLHVFIEGASVPLVSRQTRLRDRYLPGR